MENMTTRMTVLASGSSGNCTLIERPGFGFLIDVGLSSRRLAKRLADCGASWNCVKAVLLTHTHGDHWSETTLSKLLHDQIPVHCHATHVTYLRQASRSFQKMLEQDLIHVYRSDDDWRLVDGIACRAFQVQHDSGATFGFRIDMPGNLFEPPSSLAYAADLGTWNSDVVAGLCDAEILALEFNHDVGLQRASGRPPFLIERVLSDLGHLSNEQAGGLLEKVLLNSREGKLRHVVQLHLSRECNRPALAQQAARSRLFTLMNPPQVHTASQDYATVIREAAPATM